MSDKPRNRGLGRGLSALMADVSSDSGHDAPPRPDAKLPIELILPNPDQPRRHFSEDSLAELANSIREKGVIQPIIVRRDPTNEDRYQIVAGERRWRAAQQVQLHDIPVLIRDYDDTEMLEIAIIENIQRADLNAVDEASGYRQLMERFGHTQDQLASALGKSRSHIANQMRLLNLPPEVLIHVSEGRLSAGHARALVGHPEAPALASRIIKGGLSVREAERLTRKSDAPKARRSTAPAPEKDADTRQIEAELSATLKMAVSIDHAPGGEGGKITIRYRDFEQLDDLLRALSGN